MAKNEVATTQKLDLSMFQSKPGEGILGLENLSAEDIKMPRIKICQPLSSEVSDEKAKAGQFYNVTEDTAMDEINVRLLKITKSRVRWDEEFKRGDKPLCRSLDAQTSATTGESCANCSYSKWNNGNRPQCQQGYTWLGLLDDDKPFRISIKGSALAPTKSFLTECMRLNVPPFTFQVKITTEKKKDEKGTYYVPKYEILKDENGQPLVPTKAQWDSFKKTMEGLSSMFERAVDQDISSSEDAATTEEELF